jgi:hypothetical protein
VAGASKGARGATVERRWEACTLEYTFRLGVTSSRGRREELVRVAVDAESGELRSALDEDVLRHAVAVAQDETSLVEAAERALGWAVARLTPAAEAAARLARLQVLPEYQRREDHIQSTYARLLVETPTLGPDVLAARERELRRLAETHAVELDTHLVNVAAIFSPMARVRVVLRGCSVAADVDLCRAAVADPRCEACGASWRRGARCDEGHVTCLVCHGRCAHCGGRRCVRCAKDPLRACARCGLLTCESCARANARGRHRLRPDDTGLSPDQGASPDGGAESNPADAPRGPDDLDVADLDAMTPATWRVCVSWLLEGMGYAIERALPSDAASPAFVLRSAVAPAAPASSGPAHHGRLIAFAHRPAEPRAPVERDVLDRAGALARQVAAAGALVLTTATPGAASPPSAGVTVIARPDLARLLVQRGSEFHRGRAAAAVETDRRAAAASAVRAAVIAGAERVASLLEDAATAALPIAHPGAAGSPPAESLEALVDRTTRAALVARQALAALETLIEEWENSFSPVPTREGALAVSAAEVAFAGQRDRARHLTDALLEACSSVASAPAGRGVAFGAWHAAAVEELRLGCQALAGRCRSLDPNAWRSFEAAHDGAAAQEAAAALAASGRAGMRARRLLDEMAARSTTHAGHPPRDGP